MRRSSAGSSPVAIRRMDPALWPDVIGRLLRREDLPDDLIAQAMSVILSGDATDAQIAAFAVGLRAKGETAGELAALVRTMLEFAEHVDLVRCRRSVRRHVRHRWRRRRHRQRVDDGGDRHRRRRAHASPSTVVARRRRSADRSTCSRRSAW